MRLRLEVASALTTEPKVSIPLWCDCDVEGTDWKTQLRAVSIPLWCDSDGALVADLQSVSLCFNPRVVRLRPIFHHTTKMARRSFQSHCGAIATRICSATWACPVWFQSHCGAIATACSAWRVALGVCFNPTVVRLRL
ncbi:MAG: hypothetical protein RMK94_17465 [Armatimonadota bacterium]|nr:hypothetical protein [Armatimonadota bacterium]